MRSLSEFALFGGKPAFSTDVPVGQFYFPSRERYEKAMKGIFGRRYYTSQGPLAEHLEARLQQFFGVRNVVCVTNATIGLIMSAAALGLSGKVLLPAWTFIASAQSLVWAGLEPVFCDIDPRTQQLSLTHVEQRLKAGDINAVLGVHLWGGACNPVELEELSKHYDVTLYFDSAHAFGCEVGQLPVGTFGRLEVFSFHATKVLSATEGGCICTNDDNLADTLRTMRSYHVPRRMVVAKTANGRLSEAQAAVALMSLDDFPENRANNEALHFLYTSLLRAVPGLTVLQPYGVSRSNYQNLVCQVDAEQFGITRDDLLAVLKAEKIHARRYFYPAAHRSLPFINTVAIPEGSLRHTEQAVRDTLQLPLGAMVSPADVTRICETLADVQRLSAAIKARLEK